MEKFLVLSILILFTLCVHAQPGMPKELTCTETAFNFSFSFGSQFKITPPKMGPVEISGNNADYDILWRLKVNGATVQTPVASFLPKQFAVQNYEGLALMLYPGLLLPKPNFVLPFKYIIPNPAFKSSLIMVSKNPAALGLSKVF